MVSIVELLHNEIPFQEKERGTDKLHCSTLTSDDFCPKYFFLKKEHKVDNIYKYLTTSSIMTFFYGHYLSSYIRNVWLQKHVVGDWECIFCHKNHPFSLHPGDVKCKVAKGSKCSFKYNEVEVVYGKNDLVVGHIDLLLKTDHKPLLIELKSLDKDVFKTLAKPEDEHIKRTILYLHIIKHSKYKDKIDTSKATILYSCKGFGIKSPMARLYNPKDGAFSPFKEFIVRYNKNLIKDVLDLSDELRAALDSHEPPKGICSSIHDNRASNCRLNYLCFNHKEVQDDQEECS